MIRKYMAVLGILMILSISHPVFAANFITLTEEMEATVIEVIDGGHLIASAHNGTVFLRVRLIAVDPAGYDQSITFLNNTLLGKQVLVYPDNGQRQLEGRWNLAYINSEGQLLNRTLLEAGYGRLQQEHRWANHFAALEIAEQFASARRFGVWTTQNLGTNFVENAVNINTATAQELRNRLDISASLANAIVSYRTYNPFNTVEEIKFVSGVTKNFYDRTSGIMTVVTNINAASLIELLSLAEMTEVEAQRIISRRNANAGFNTIDELRLLNLISITRFNQIADFISVSDESELRLYLPNQLFDLNEVSAAQLRDLTGMTAARANTVIDNRENYSYKTLGELVPLGVFTQNELNRWSDNLSLYHKETDYININTATKQDLESLGISSSDADLIVAQQGKMRGSRTIPVDLSAWDSRISLYTNINMATEKELRSLHPDITNSLISAIFSYRSNQVFGSNAEIEDFFADRNNGGLYRQIQDFLVVQ